MRQAWKIYKIAWRSMGLKWIVMAMAEIEKKEIYLDHETVINVEINSGRSEI